MYLNDSKTKENVHFHRSLTLSDITFCQNTRLYPLYWRSRLPLRVVMATAVWVPASRWHADARAPLSTVCPLRHRSHAEVLRPHHHRLHRRQHNPVGNTLCNHDNAPIQIHTLIMNLIFLSGGSWVSLWINTFFAKCKVEKINLFFMFDNIIDCYNMTCAS